MNCLELIKTRRSVRSFDGEALRPEDREKLAAFAQTIQNPYGIPVDFVFLDAKEHGLSSPVIVGEGLYVAGLIERRAHAEEAFGYSFEKLLLYAWSLGVGSTWIGGTMKRELFERAAGLSAGRLMPCVSPLGYPAKKMSVRESLMRKGVKADERKPASELFFDGDLRTPLVVGDAKLADALEMLRFAPSAVNRQPWRVVREGESFHFYLRHDKGYVGAATGDLQKVDMGIALCHFLYGLDGELLLADPGLSCETGTEYIATVRLR